MRDAFQKEFARFLDAQLKKADTDFLLRRSEIHEKHPSSARMILFSNGNRPLLARKRNSFVYWPPGQMAGMTGG
jgi:hypothetical protein